MLHVTTASKALLLLTFCFLVATQYASCFSLNKEATTTMMPHPTRTLSTTKLSMSVPSSPPSSPITDSSDDATTTTTTATTLEESNDVTNKNNNNPRKEGLALQLDDGTRKSHSIAQNSAFVTGFFKGLSNKESYSKLLTSLYYVYVAMEDEFDATTEEYVKIMDDPELRRVNAAKLDMEFFYGGQDNTNWQSSIPQPSKATQKYVQRIHEVATNQPKLLIAHQYTRYLGDLFGGQMMGNMASKSLNLPPDGKGIEFYTFDNINNTQDFITQWYTKLNELALTTEEKKAIVDEANLVFDLNIEILEELDGSAMKAVLSLVWKSFKEKVFCGGLK